MLPEALCSAILLDWRVWVVAHGKCPVMMVWCGEEEGREKGGWWTRPLAKAGMNEERNQGGQWLGCWVGDAGGGGEEGGPCAQFES